jgi:hypothetical protein
MKKLFIAAFLLMALHANAQNETTDEKKPFFKKENLIVGGDFSLFFGTGSFFVGASPYLGYSLTNFLDVAISGNFNYQSVRDAPYDQSVTRLTTIGPGAFVRLFPLSSFYVQAQFERNFLSQKEIYPQNTIPAFRKVTAAASSYLLGAGYCSGREGSGSAYYYFSVMFDAGDDINSPYIDRFGRKDPIIRAGFNFPLFGSSGNSGGGSKREARRSRRGDEF